jgi:hypothetical protein
MTFRHALVVAVAVLAVAAQPAAAGNVAVASEHTTFGTGSGEAVPATTTAMSIEGSAESASVVYESSESSITTAVKGNSAGIRGSSKLGIVITPNEDLSRLTIEPADTLSATRVYVVRNSDGAVLADQQLNFQTTTITGLSLSAGTEYRVLVDDDGSSYDAPAGSESFPLTSNTFDIVSGWLAGSKNSNSVYAIASLTASPPRSASYQSAIHDVDNAVEARVNLSTVQNADVSINITEVQSGDQVGSTTVSSSGTHTVTLNGVDETQLRTSVNTSATSGDASVTLTSEAILADTSPPSLSDPDPTGSIETYDSEISIDVNDTDFGTPQGDSVTVTATDSNGDQIGSQTVSSNTTAALSYSGTIGNNSITWDAEDTAGNTDTASQSFETPSQLRIYKETKPTELVDDNITLRARFYVTGTPTVVEREVTDGTVSLGGLPNDQFVVTVRANDTSKYTYRRIIIESITRSQNVYLLNQSEPHSRVVFELEDPTGEFPPEETFLQIQKAITKDYDSDGTNETQYQVIAGDTFGAQGTFPAQLRDDERYRLRVKSNDSARVLGAYSVYGDVRETLQIQRIEPSGDTTSDATIYGSLQGEGANRELAIRYRDLASQTQSVEYRVVRADGSVVVPNTTVTAQQFADIYSVTSNESARFTVEYTIRRDSGTRSGEFYAGGVPGVAGRFPIDAQVLSIISWIVILATMGLLVIVDTRLAPMGGVGVASALTIMGTVAIPAALLGVAGVVAALVLFGGSR